MSAPYFLQCVPAADGIAVAPCGTVEGVALVPSLVSAVPEPLDYSQLHDLFIWAAGIPVTTWLVGLGIGSIIRVLRS